LTQGWEIYRGELLTPANLAEQQFTPSSYHGEYVYLGQYGGFEGDDLAGNPHGSATYRLHITLPREAAAYTLELPEIYSAYILYINGIKVEQFGDPAPESYRPQTGISSVSFLAQNRVELIFAVSDFSHIYSGMVYPPAFGLAGAVAGLLQTRWMLRTALVTIAWGLALFFAVVGYLMARESTMLTFAAICFCWGLYISYPLFMSLRLKGLSWYTVENQAFIMLLFLVALLQKIILPNTNRYFAPIRTLAGVVSLVSLVIFSFTPSNLLVLGAFSLLVSSYKGIMALYLTYNSLQAAKENPRYGWHLLAGVLAFDVTLIMDRMLPSYEPIVGGWFIEWGGLALVMTIAAIIFQETLRHYREKLVLEGRIQGTENFLHMQRAYYPLMLRDMAEARRARHDLRHHSRVLQGFLATEDYAKLKDYLDNFSETLPSERPLSYGENRVADIILRHFALLAQQQEVSLSLEANLPPALAIDDADLAIVLSNLLENALEACAYVTHTTPWTKLVAKEVRSQLIILVDNSYDGQSVNHQGVFFSRKRGDRPGEGLASVRAVAEKYRGWANFNPNPTTREFHSEVALSLKGDEKH